MYTNIKKCIYKDEHCLHRGIRASRQNASPRLDQFGLHSRRTSHTQTRHGGSTIAATEALYICILYTIILYLYTNSNRNRFSVGQILGIHFPCLPADIDAVLWSLLGVLVLRVCVLDNLIIIIGRKECVPENMCLILCLGR